MHFAKVFTIGENQILFTKDYQTERIGEKTYGIAYRVDIDTEDKIEGRFGYDDQENMEKYWRMIGLSMAGNILSQSLKIYTNG